MAINQNSKIWEGVYQSFSEVDSEQPIFEGTVWLDKIIERAKSLTEQTRSEGVICNGISTSDYALPFIAAGAARRGESLKILDFGGGLGTSYIPLSRMLHEDVALEFVIVENRTICEKGRSFFEHDNRIHFQEEIPEKGSFHIVHSGSSFHYVDDWKAVLSKFNDTGAEYLIFADLPAGDIDTFVTAQWFHGRQIPVRFWDINEFTDAVEMHSFELIMKTAYRGYYLDNNAKLPTSHFDDRHRLDQFCQLVFRRTLPRN